LDPSLDFYGRFAGLVPLSQKTTLLSGRPNTCTKQLRINPMFENNKIDKNFIILFVHKFGL
jgi:hypothetical protein